MHPDDPKGSCCAPTREANGTATPATGEFRRINTGSTEGMKLIPGGEFLMGNDGDYGFPADGEGPVHPVRLNPFWLDATAVTNAQFNDFVNTTGYRTESEKFGWSFVFFGHLTPAQQAATERVRVLGSEWWCRVDGATWRHPEGPASNIKKRWDHPVVQVSWHDAAAYAAWAGKRLPTEAEWECAARGGLVQKRFPWGDELEPEGKHRMNVWQGTFPTHNTEADGHFGPSPAKTYRANGHGLYQMTGNVWEWCNTRWGRSWQTVDFTYPYHAGDGRENPDTTNARIIRGGSWFDPLPDANPANRGRYLPGSRGTNISFRLAPSP